jgi:hypothetical protein
MSRNDSHLSNSTELSFGFGLDLGGVESSRQCGTREVGKLSAEFDGAVLAALL